MKFNLQKFLSVIQTITPVIIAMIPGGEKLAPIVPNITRAIAEAEQIPGASGADKKKHVMEIVKAGILTVNTTGRITLNQADVEAIADNAIDAVIATVHVIEGAKVQKAAATEAGGDQALQDRRQA